MALPRGADDIYRAASPQAPAPQAEKAKNYELGWRLNRPTFNAAWALYRSDFANRLQAFASPVPGSSQVETYYQNVGRAQAWGSELSGQRLPQGGLPVSQQSPEPEDRLAAHPEAVSLGRLPRRRGDGGGNAQRGGVEGVGAASRQEDREQHGQRPAGQPHKPGTRKV